MLLVLRGQEHFELVLRPAVDIKIAAGDLMTRWYLIRTIITLTFTRNWVIQMSKHRSYLTGNFTVIYLSLLNHFVPVAAKAFWLFWWCDAGSRVSNYRNVAHRFQNMPNLPNFQISRPVQIFPLFIILIVFFKYVNSIILNCTLIDREFATYK